MVEEVLFESERRETRAEVASHLQQLAANLERGDAITLTADTQSVTLDPPAELTVEFKAEREGPEDEPGELSIEVELEWDEQAEGTADAFSVE